MSAIKEDVEGKPSRGQKFAVEPRFRHVKVKFLDQPERKTRKKGKGRKRAEGEEGGNDREPGVYMSVFATVTMAIDCFRTACIVCVKSQLRHM